MSTIRSHLHSIQFKKKNAFETYFPYHTIFSLIIGFHLGRHLGYIEMLNDARVASLRFFKYNVCTTRINKEKNFKIKFQVPLKYAQILPDYGVCHGKFCLFPYCQLQRFVQMYKLVLIILTYYFCQIQCLVS